MDDYQGGPTAGEAFGANRPTVYLTPLAQDYLDRTRPWVRLMSIVTFAAAVLMVLVGAGMLVFSLVGAAWVSEPSNPFGSAVFGSLMALCYVCLALVYVFPGLYLHRYASAIGLLRRNPDALVLQDALEHQKSFWRFVGILTVIGVVVSLLGLVLAIAVPVLVMIAGAGRP